MQEGAVGHLKGGSMRRGTITSSQEQQQESGAYTHEEALTQIAQPGDESS
jgi:hypothetical protein